MCASLSFISRYSFFLNLTLSHPSCRTVLTPGTVSLSRARVLQNGLHPAPAVLPIILSIVCMYFYVFLMNFLNCFPPVWLKWLFLFKLRTCNFGRRLLCYLARGQRLNIARLLRDSVSPLMVIPHLATQARFKTLPFKVLISYINYC